MIFENEDKFRHWLIDILNDTDAAMVRKHDTFFAKYLAVVEEAVELGHDCIELSHKETRDGYPAEYRFEVGENADAVYDCGITVTF